MKYIYSVVLCSLFITSWSFAQMTYIPVSDQSGKVRRFSRLIMGTDHLRQAQWVQNSQEEASKEQVFNLLDQAVKNGINVIDSSPIYVGGIEHLVGEWYESREALIKSEAFYNNKNLNPDREVYFISKGGFPFDLFYSKTLEGTHHFDELIASLSEQNILTSKSVNA